MNTTPTLIGAADVCRRAHVSKPTLINDVRAGRIQPIGKVAGVNGPYVFSEDEAARYARERQTNAA